ncbi:MAG: hypothetical protein ACXWLR_05515, partial [Myxococcales bacterium]
MLLLLLASLLGTRLAERAEAAAGLRSVRQLSPTATDDCSGFVRAIYGREGVDLTTVPPRPGENGVTHLHRLATARGALRRRPRPGA